MSSLEELIPDFHLSLGCDHLVKSQIPHLPPEVMQVTEYVTSGSLDLSRKKLQDVDCILNNRMLKNLYLEGNQISSLPDSLFTSLSNLVWLDVRNNQIKSIPAEIGLHRCLKTLLLEGNPITELPPELGNVLTLRALSLRFCPVTFPPPEVVRRGLRPILHYLRSAMADRPVSTRNPPPDEPLVEKLALAELVRSSLDLGEDTVDEHELRRFRELRQRMIQMERAELGLAPARLPRTAEGDRAQKTYALPVVKRDQEYLREWRTHARIMQERKIFEQKQEWRERHRREETSRETAHSGADARPRLSHSEAAAGLASDSAVWLHCAESVILQQADSSTEALTQLPAPQNAPYAADSQHGAPDRAGVTTPPRLRRQTCFLSQREVEEARAARDRELEQRIRSHVQMMQERRRTPQGTAQEETAAARRDMEEAQKLQAELIMRKQEKDLEYRFLAFTGENLPGCSDK